MSKRVEDESRTDKDSGHGLFDPEAGSVAGVSSLSIEQKDT